LIDRKQFGWNIQISCPETGRTEVVEFWSYWSVESDPVGAAAGVATAAMKSYMTKKRWIPISAEQIDAEIPDTLEELSTK